MSRAVFVVFFMVAFAVCGSSVIVDTEMLERLSEAERKELNDWMAERAQTMYKASQAQADLKRAWLDESYRSVEVDALRARYRAVQQELTRLQVEIQRKVEETPAGRVKKEECDKLNAKVAELNEKIKSAGGKK